MAEEGQGNQEYVSQGAVSVVDVPFHQSANSKMTLKCHHVIKV